MFGKTWVLFSYLFVVTAGWVFLWHRLTETDDDRATAESLNMTGTAAVMLGVFAAIAGLFCAAVLTAINRWLVKRHVASGNHQSGQVFGLMVAASVVLQLPVMGFSALAQDFGGIGFSIIQIVLWIVGVALYTQTKLRL